MEPCLGLRLVRGPDWCWEDQDGGEGSVGTLVEVVEGGRSALVQWDGGTRGRYRCGEDGKFELRVLDVAPTGRQFPDIICSGCYVEGVAGIHWQCAHCYKYQLCHSCYLLGRHCLEHPFFRVEAKEQTTRSMVSCRAGAKRVEAKGIFVGAEVVRGPNWRFGDQDGGAGKKGRVVAIEGYKTLTARSIAAVKWVSEGLANIYRVGHKGKVDICCTVAGGDGHYYPEHLAVLGCVSTVTTFDEDEIVAGDLVKVELDLELFKMMHESVGLWSSIMSELCDTSLIVMSVLEHGMLRCNSQSLQSRTICYDAVVKLKHCGVGQTVRIISDLTVLHKLQNDNAIWHDDMIMMAGQIGRVIKCYDNISLQVYTQGRGWLFNPLCLEPAPGETAPYTPDPLNECISSIWKSNTTPKELQERFERLYTDEALLKGDLTALESFLYSNQIQADMKAMIFNYYLTTGMMDALRLILECDDIGPLVKTGRGITACISHHNKEALAAMLDAGTNVNSFVDEKGSMSLLFWVVRYGNFDHVKMLAVSPGVLLDVKSTSDGITAIRAAAAISDHKKVAVLLAAGANPIDETTTSLSALHDAVCGKMALTEAFVVHAKKYLNCLSDQGAAPLHLAAFNNQPRICSLLAAEASVDLNIKWRGVLYTPLHVAITQSYWSVVECLVGWGAALDPVGKKGDTALHVAINVKNAERPTSPTLKRIHEELSLLAGGKEVKGYIAVVCFLVHEGADWHIKDKKGVSPHQALPSAVAALIAKYLRSHPGPGTFHGSLRREQQQRRMQELPLQLDLSLHSSPGSATSAAEACATATDKIDRKTGDHKAKDYANFDCGGKTGFATKLVSERNTYTPKKSTFEEATVVTSQQTPTSAAKLSTSGPTTQLPPGASQPGGASRQLCLLCEEHPAIIKFSPCGHTLLCSRCAERAKKCPQCKAFVESKIIETDL